MASAFQKFKQLENQKEPSPKNGSADKPSRKKQPQIYSHLVTKFETLDGDERKRIVQERLKQRQIEKEAKLEEERKRKLEEEERRKRQLEEEERIRRLQEEEEERRRKEEEIRILEEEEARRIAEEKKKNEGKFAGLRPAAAMFEKALEAKRSMQKSIKGERVITLRKGTISEIRSKIFDNQPEDVNIPKPIKPKKLILDNKQQNNEKKSTHSESPRKVHEKHNEPDQKSLQKSKIETMEIAPKVENEEAPQENIPMEVDQKGTKRQSFISDFAALEKTYKILGMSAPKDQTITEETPTKKRHNSEGKVKSKEKAKKKATVKKAESVKKVEEPSEPVKKTEEPSEIVPSALDKLEKGRAAQKMNFFQSLINEKKGIVKKEPELNGPQLRKRTSLTNTFGTTNEDESKRRSFIKDDIKVDKKQFNSFLDKFESQDQRAEAKSQMIKLTANQKEIDKQKLKRKQEQALAAERERLIAEEKQRREQEERDLQLALEEEARLMRLREEEEERLRVLEAEKKIEPKSKKKMLKKKKKALEEPQESIDMPKLNLAVINYSDVKNKFEKKDKDQVDVDSSQNKTLKIKKLNNPFLENLNSEDKPKKQEVKVNKLQKNAFMMELEKQASVNEEVKPEPRLKKISSDAHIKFESKKERNIPKDETVEVNSAEKKPQVHVSKSIEGHHPKKKNSKDNKTGSTLSLQKIFVDGPRQFLKSSKEKLYKLSKENLYEIQKPLESKPLEPKLSKSEMQNYLLSHVLFDGSETKKKEKKQGKQKKEDDDIEQYLDQEYKEKINQYCSLLEEEKKPKRKKKKKVEEKKPTAPSMKLVEIKSIQQQLFQNHNQSNTAEKPVKPEIDVSYKRVNKFKELFDNENEGPSDTELLRGQRENKREKRKSNIFDKIQALEKAEEERYEREKAYEERMKKLVMLELERQKNREDDENEKTIDNVAEENFKNDIMKCLEDEVENLEQEMLALDTEEQLILDEENEQDQANDNETEREEEEENHIHQLHEIQHEIEERKKTAANKRNVLKRFQHVLDTEKSDDDGKFGRKVGSIKDKLNNFLLESNDKKNVKAFDDGVFVGVSEVMSKFKSKIESQEDNAPSLFSKDEIKRKPNMIALQFEKMMEDEEEIMSPTLQPAKEWNWKKKTAQELHEEVEGTKEKEKDSEPKKRNSTYQDKKFEELLADIDAVKRRLNERDAVRQEKENDRRLKEMEESIKEVQEALRKDSVETTYENIETPKMKRKREMPTEIKSPQLPMSRSNNKIEELKTQLLSMIQEKDQEKLTNTDSIDVNVSQVRDQLFQTDDTIKDTQKNNIQSSTKLVSKLAEKLMANDEKEYEEVKLQKVPKRILTLDEKMYDEPPAKTLEELKAENTTKKWAWKEKDMSDIQNYITAYDDVAPKQIRSQYQKLKELDEEQKVVESLTKDKNTAILIQLREEKEMEFEKFMNEIHSYLEEGSKNVEELEFKKGIQGYVDLIDDSPKKKMNNETNESNSLKINKSEVSNVKQIFEQSKNQDYVQQPKRSPPKSEVSNVKHIFEQNTNEKETIPQAKKVPLKSEVSSFKQIFEQSSKKEIVPETKKTSPKRQSLVEKFKNKAIDEKRSRMEHQVKHKSKTILELHDYLLNHKNLANENLLYCGRSFKVATEIEKIKVHTEFIDMLEKFIKTIDNSEEGFIFRSNIQSYLVILNNMSSNYNATPKLRSHNRSTSNCQSNIKKAILEKSTEKKVEQSKTVVKDIKPPTRVLSPEEKKKEILAKYGFRDHTSNIVIQQISDDSDSSDSEEDEDVKNLTDKQLAEKFGLPYIEIPEEKSISKSDSAAGYTSLLSKIRSLNTEKSQPVVTQNKDIYERRNSNKNIEKSDSMAKIIKNFEADSTDSPVPSGVVTRRIHKKLNEQPIQRRSWVFENDSPDSSRCSTPTREPGTIMTSKMKKLFEDASKEATAPQTPSIQNRGLMKSSTISNVGAALQNKNTITRKNFEEERIKMTMVQSPSMTRPNAIEKSKSLSKIKHAFEFGKGCNDELEDGSIESRKSINAELELLRSGSSKDISSPKLTSKPSNNSETGKSSLVSAFFSENRERSGSFSKDRSSLLAREVHMRKNVGLQKSSTASDIQMSKIKNAFEFGKGFNDEIEDVKTESRKSINAELELLRSGSSKDVSSPKLPTKSNQEDDKKANLVSSFFSGESRERSNSISKERNSPRGKSDMVLKQNTGLQKSSTASDISAYLRNRIENKEKESPGILRKALEEKNLLPSNTSTESPMLKRGQEVARSSSFSKFKNNFEEGVGTMDADTLNSDKARVNAELTALKSSSKIQNMFRINRSNSIKSEDEVRNKINVNTSDNECRNRSNSVTMEEDIKAVEVQRKSNENYTNRNQNSPNQKEDDGELQGRKWVFDTIQKYFDVIVEEGEEDEDDEEEEEKGDESGSESDYTSAEDEIPEIILTPSSNTISNPQPKAAEPVPRQSNPFYSLPMQRATPRASTVSPLCLPSYSQSHRKSSVISIDDLVDNAARQFDQLTDGEDFDDSDIECTKKSLQTSSSSQSVNKLMRSSSSSKMRGLFKSVVHGSGSSLNVSTFKSNLLAHLKRSGSGNLDPGVDDDSSSEYSEYDD